jgi:hypothetical protein
MEMFVAIDAVDDLVHNAKRKLLRRDEVQVDREVFRAALARVRAGMRLSIPDVVAPQMDEPLRRLERMCEVGEGHLTLNTEAVYDELDQMRALAPLDVKRQRR